MMIYNDDNGNSSKGNNGWCSNEYNCDTKSLLLLLCFLLLCGNDDESDDLDNDYEIDVK